MSDPTQAFRLRLHQVIGDRRTQESFAAEIGVDQSTLSRWLKGSSVPSRRMAVRMLRRYPELRDALMDVLLAKSSRATTDDEADEDPVAAVAS